MIPKVFHLFWAGARLSYLRYLTLATLRHHHASWRIVFHTSEDSLLQANWEHKHLAHEFQADPSGRDYTKEAHALVDEVREFCYPGIAPNFQSDFFRWSVLKEGGFYLDMDQIILKPFDDLVAHKFIYAAYDGIRYYTPVGVLAAEPCHAFVNKVCDELPIRFDPGIYNSAGPFLIEALLNETNIINNENSFNSGDIFYPVKFAEQVDDVYNGRLTIAEKHYALHWFGAWPSSQAFNRTYSFDVARKGSDTISRELKRMGLVEEYCPGIFDFGRSVKNIKYNYGRMELAAGGRIRRYNNFNERTWSGDEQEITLYDGAGSPTTILKPVLGIYEGQCLADPGIVHHLVPVVTSSKVKYLINTNIDYYIPMVIQGLKPRLVEQGIPEEDIVIVVSGSSAPTTDPNIIHTLKSAWDLTALIEVSAGDWDEDIYWIYLHDSVEIGAGFAERTQALNTWGGPQIVYAAADRVLNVGRPMGWNNIGAYSQKFLKSVSHHLQKLVGLSRSDSIAVEFNEHVFAPARLASRISTFPGQSTAEYGPIKMHNASRMMRWYHSISAKKAYNLPAVYEKFTFTPKKAKPRIMLVADVPKWVFERHCFSLRDRLSHKFDIDISYCVGGDFHNYDLASYDLILPMEMESVPPGDAHKFKAIAGIRCEYRHDSNPLDYWNTMKGWEFASVYAVSRRIQRQFADVGVALPYAPHGYEPSIFNPGKRSTHSDLRVGFAGNYCEHKGVHLLERLSTLPGVTVLSAKSDHENRTHRSAEEMAEFYRDLDVYICLSISEGHNNSLMEAGACGCMLISTRTGTAEEYISPEIGALVSRDYNEVEAILKGLVSDKSIAAAKGNKASVLVRDKWSWDVLIREYDGLITNHLRYKGVL